MNLWSRFLRSVLWRWCPECIHNATERADAVNSAIYWRQNSDDVRVCAYGRGILVDRLLREGAAKGAWTREDLEEMAVALAVVENGPRQDVRRFAADELRRQAGVAPSTKNPTNNPPQKEEAGVSS